MLELFELIEIMNISWRNEFSQCHFLEDEFPSFWWNFKNISNSISYNKTFNHLSMRRMIWILTKLSRMVHLPYLIGMMKVYLLRRMNFFLNLQMFRRVILKRFNMKMRFIIDLLFLNMQLVYMFRILHLQWIAGVILCVLLVSCLLEKRGGILDLVPLRERGSDSSPREANNEGPRIQRSGHGIIFRRYL